MTTLVNSIEVNASIENIWKELAEVERLSGYDPASKNAKQLNGKSKGVGAKRRVDMTDEKNWFEEECTVYEEHRALRYDLTACSFPVHNLNHAYQFEALTPGKIRITQVQQYQMKYGYLGQIMGLLLKRKWDNGVKLFLRGLKQKAENN